MLNQFDLRSEIQTRILSANVPLADFVNHQTDVNRRLWFSAEETFPNLGRVYSANEKRENEKKLSEQIDWLALGLKRNLQDEASQKIFAEAAGHRFKVLGMGILGLNYEQLVIFENEALINSSQQFFQRAREFDPEISIEDIFQGSRNVWTSNYLQVLLGLEVKLTPSIFAYSMLYPVTDNYLDDPKRSSREKLEFNQRFCGWLRGESIASQNAHEEKVCQLVRMIEGQYDRNLYPQVYESLLAIHCAQDVSMRLPKLPVAPHSVDVLGVALAKGGTSVLADGVLAAGELNARQMEVIFNYGAFAQFMDDQEDIAEDLKTRSLTVFSEAARFDKLDLTMNRLFSFSSRLLRGLGEFSTSRSAPLIQLSLKGINLLLIDTCFRTHQYYSRTYLQKLEAHFPVRFSYMKELRRQIKQKNLSIERLVKAFFPATHFA